MDWPASSSTSRGCVTTRMEWLQTWGVGMRTARRVMACCRRSVNYKHHHLICGTISSQFTDDGAAHTNCSVLDLGLADRAIRIWRANFKWAGLSRQDLIPPLLVRLRNVRVPACMWKLIYNYKTRGRLPGIAIGIAIWGKAGVCRIKILLANKQSCTWWKCGRPSIDAGDGVLWSKLLSQWESGGLPQKLLIVC